MAGLFHFSQNPEENDVAAAPVNWSENMPARGVNNSSREEMAALARWYTDTNGNKLATGATANALSLTSEQGLTLAKPFEIAFTVDGRNNGPTSLNVDDTGPRALQRSGNIDLGPGDLRSGILYRARFHPTLNRYILTSPAPESPGRIGLFATVAAVPDGWVICDGRGLSRTSYAALFAAIGTAFGGSGSNFNVPDLRGRAAFGADDFGTGAAGRLTGAGGIDGALGTAGGTETTTLTSDQMPSHTHTGSTSTAGAQAATTTGDAGAVPARTTGSAGGHGHDVSISNAGGHTHNGTATAATGHAHTYKTALTYNNTAGSGNTNGPYWSGERDVPTSTENPTFDVTTTTAGSHTHDAAATAVGPHAHSIPAVDAHNHSIPAVAAHAHTLSLNNAGGGGAHPNLPPGLCLIFAIKA